MKKTDTILITGASGLAGGWLRNALAGGGYTQTYLLDLLPSGEGSREFNGSVTDADFINQVIGEVKPAFVFHLAGLVGQKPPDQMTGVNVNGTRYLLEALVHHSLTGTRVLITSSSAVYGDKGKERITEEMSLCPTSTYGVSKAKQEEVGLHYYSEYGIPVIISRAFNNFAPGEKAHMFISRITSQIAKIEKGSSDTLKIGPLHSYRDYLDTRDVVDAYVQIMEKGIPGEIYNVCSGEPVKINDLFLFLIKSARVSIKYEVVAYDQKGNVPYQCGNPDKLKGLSGWEKKRDINTTLLEILDYWREQV